MNPSADAQAADEILLRSGDFRAVVSPLGASLRAFWQEPAAGGRRDLAWPYRGAENKKGGQGDVLIPFPGRIVAGAYSFAGRPHQLERNDKEGPNAIHGFVRTRRWSARASDSGATFKLRLPASGDGAAPGYPFSLEIAVGYALGPDGLTCDFSIQNTGDAAAPVGAGFHPYFVTGEETIDSAWLELPASRSIELGPNLLPTGRVLPVEGTAVDFRELRRIGETRFNHCLGGLSRDGSGIARARLLRSDRKAGIEVWMDRTLDYLVVYSGEALGPDARRSLAIEPMTCGTDAFNHPDWGLISLEPGQYAGGRWGARPIALDVSALRGG